MIAAVEDGGRLSASTLSRGAQVAAERGPLESFIGWIRGLGPSRSVWELVESKERNEGTETRERSVSQPAISGRNRRGC